MGLRVAGMGTNTPPHSRSQAELASLAGPLCSRDEREVRRLEALYRRSGIKRRAGVLPHAGAGSDPWSAFFGLPLGDGDRGPTTAERMRVFADEAVELAEPACRRALEQASVAARSVTHLVTVSCTGFTAPGPDIQLIKRLGLDRGVKRVQVGWMGCHGALNGLQVALSHAAAQLEARVLLCCTELCGLHFQYGWNPELLVGNALFADGSAALLGLGSRDRTEPWTLVDTVSLLLEDSEDLMGWRIGDHGFEMTLSPRVPDHIAGRVPDWLCGWLGGHGLKPQDVGSWAVHPGGVRVLQKFEQAMELGPEELQVSREVLAEHGNMSSPTVLFVLSRLREMQARRPCVMIAFGPGLVAEAGLLV